MLGDAEKMPLSQRTREFLQTLNISHENYAEADSIVKGIAKLESALRGVQVLPKRWRDGRLRRCIDVQKCADELEEALSSAGLGEEEKQK